MRCWNWCCGSAWGDGGQRGAAAHRKPVAPLIIVGLALIGLAVAFTESYAIYAGQPLWCPPLVDGCNTVAASPYARIFGLPIGYYGLVYYGGMLGLAVLLAFDPRSPALRAAAVLYAATGLAFSLYFMVLQIGTIRAFCIYCAVSGLTTLLLVISTGAHWSSTRRQAIEA